MHRGDRYPLGDARLGSKKSRKFNAIEPFLESSKKSETSKKKTVREKKGDHGAGKKNEGGKAKGNSETCDRFGAKPKVGRVKKGESRKTNTKKKKKKNQAGANYEMFQGPATFKTGGDPKGEKRGRRSGGPQKKTETLPEKKNRFYLGLREGRKAQKRER